MEQSFSVCKMSAGALGAGPGTRFRLEHEGNAIRLIPEAKQAFWEILSPGERVRTFLDWVAGLPKRGSPAAASID